MIKRYIRVHDRMQQKYCYQLTHPPGRNFDPDFNPDLTPKQMLQLGVFGGKYMNDTRDEFPKTWFAKAKLSPLRPDASCNYFGVKASQPLSVWKKKGWIFEDDPRGWFQWYCRYYRAAAFPKRINGKSAAGRQCAAILSRFAEIVMNCHRKRRQALLHWAYDSRKI